MVQETVVSRIRTFGARDAVVDATRSLSYEGLAAAAEDLAARLLDGDETLETERVVLLIEPSVDYVVALLAIWCDGAVAVPLKAGVPAPEIDHVLEDAAPARLLTTRAMATDVAELAERRGVTVVVVDDQHPKLGEPTLPQVTPQHDALMLYTSGTTGRPKGVVHTHASLAAQMRALTRAWAWSSDDRILLTLPLHHIHGVVNVLGCALWSGAVCRIHATFDAVRVWESFADDDLTLFMAVPTIYGRLLDAWEAAEESTRVRWSAGARSLQLMVSGSAALPVSTLDRWSEVAGHVLLERYGMTEIGMALSNTLERRIPGRVGWPLPGVEIRVVDDESVDVSVDESGELLVRSPGVCKEYWRLPKVTAAAFDDGWFRTGDVVVQDSTGSVKVLGRASVDIIKSGGEKVSALEVEEVFRAHEAISDCAVVGIEDHQWGERVCMALVVTAEVSEKDLRAWGKARLAGYKVPRAFVRVPELPRNAMGKVVKPEAAALFHRD